MTVKELSQLYWLNKEIEMNQKRLEELKAKKDSLSSPDFSGVSRGGDGTSRVEWLAVEISDLEKLIQKKQQQCILEHKRLERYIAKIPDSLTRQIFTLRFVNGLKWFQVAMTIGAAHNPLLPAIPGEAAAGFQKIPRLTAELIPPAPHQL